MRIPPRRSLRARCRRSSGRGGDHVSALLQAAVTDAVPHANDAPRLLAGPPLEAGLESWQQHRARLGELPAVSSRNGIIASLERSGLIGRGGAGFPVGQKWRSVAERTRGGAVVVANGAEGEPRSAK